MIPVQSPFIDFLIFTLDDISLSSSNANEAIAEAVTELKSVLSDLAPVKDDETRKRIWVTFPRGEMMSEAEYDKWQDYLFYDGYEEYTERWAIDNPDEIAWYNLSFYEGLDEKGKPDYIGIDVNGHTILQISTRVKKRESTIDWYGHPAEDEPEDAEELIRILTDGARKSMAMLRDGAYNDFVGDNLPYRYRNGIIRRSELWIIYPEEKEELFAGLSNEDIEQYEKYVEAGAEDEERIGRIKSFTGNTFLEACAIAYKACGCSTEGLTPAEQYVRFADGRDEGLLGEEKSPHSEGDGIDLASPKAWDDWYFGKRFGGHPWEIRRGYSQIIELRVESDFYRNEYIRGRKTSYYFSLGGGSKRINETVKIYLALRKAGYPVRLSGAEEILDRLRGTDLIGIIPDNGLSETAEEQLLDRYENIAEFTSLDDEECRIYRDKISWIEPEKARLVN